MTQILEISHKCVMKSMSISRDTVIDAKDKFIELVRPNHMIDTYALYA